MTLFRSRALMPAALVLSSCYSFLVAGACAQSPASLHGRAVGADGKPLANAVIQVVSDQAARPGRAWRYTMVADSLGKFSQEGLAPGAYLVMLFADGKGTNVLRSVLLKAGSEQALDLALTPTVQLAGGSLTDEKHRISGRTR